jgi:hypothetical protein
MRVASNTLYAQMHARARRICSALYGSALVNALNALIATIITICIMTHELALAMRATYSVSQP